MKHREVKIEVGGISQQETTGGGDHFQRQRETRELQVVPYSWSYGVWREFVGDGAQERPFNISGYFCKINSREQNAECY